MSDWMVDPTPPPTAAAPPPEPSVRRAPVIASTALTSYLSGQQDGQQWALIDNLDADEVRQVAEDAITMLRQANPIIALASLALDGMTPRAQRFAAREACLAFCDPYLADLAQRLGGDGA